VNGVKTMPMNKEHIQELRSAFDRALSELAAIAESEILPYEVRAAAMQSHVGIAANANATIAHLMSAITPSGVIGTMVKGADLVAALDKQAKRISNATMLGVMDEFKSGPDEHILAAPSERPDNEHADALPFRGLAKGENANGVVVPHVPTAFITSNWGKHEPKDVPKRDWFDVNE
jgi:hypothetical protein